MKAPARHAKRRLIHGVLAIIGLALMPLTVQPARAADGCSVHLMKVEQRLHIPSGLLLAISLVESGMDGEPQPYAISVGIRSYVANGPGAAIHFLRDRNGNLRRDVFVGCMQISLRDHYEHFKPVERIVDPEANVWYAGKHLVALHGQFGSWSAAVAHYQGGSPRQASAYVCRVWNRLAELDWKSAHTIELPQCHKTETAEIAPRTRRAFHDAQVASTER